MFLKFNNIQIYCLTIFIKHFDFQNKFNYLYINIVYYFMKYKSKYLVFDPKNIFYYSYKMCNI